MSPSTTSRPSDGAVAAPAVGGRRKAFHKLRVADITPLTDDALTITFDVPEELRDEYRFQAGQHVAIMSELAGDEVRRNYSICAPESSGTLRVAVKRLPEGVFSGYAHSTLKVGDELDVLTPAGRFVTLLDPAHAKHYAAIAAGSGITPVISILASALEAEPDSECTLIYANRTTRSIMFLEELQDLKNRYPTRFAFYNVLSREQQDVEMFSGRIDGAKLDAFLQTVLPPDTVDEWFLCGPMEMVDSLRDALLARGVDSHHVHRELFHTGPLPSRPRADATAVRDAGAAEVTIVLDGRRSTFEVPKLGEPILDAALRVRADAPFACKGGVCGTCRARLVEGEVEMDQNYALEADEQEAGFVLACQSHPTTERVTLDFDT
jgi:ring-1,2-phenylacetyl-CoA epoxidase subunit PaaE